MCAYIYTYMCVYVSAEKGRERHHVREQACVHARRDREREIERERKSASDRDERASESKCMNERESK